MSPQKHTTKTSRLTPGKWCSNLKVLRYRKGVITITRHPVFFRVNFCFDEAEPPTTRQYNCQIAHRKLVELLGIMAIIPPTEEQLQQLEVQPTKIYLVRKVKKRKGYEACSIKNIWRRLKQVDVTLLCIDGDLEDSNIVLFLNQLKRLKQHTVIPPFTITASGKQDRRDKVYSIIERRV